MSFIYKGLEAEYKRHLVTDTEVDTQMERLRQQTPQVKVITDRSAQTGDELVLDYAGFCDGEQFAGGTAQQQTLVLGSGMFIPGFEEQLVGSHPGENVTVEVTFPEQYHAPELAGKAAKFECLVREIREKTAYEMDDNFAKALGVETFEQLRQQLQESMQRYADDRGELDLEDQLIRKAAQTLEFQADEAQIEEAVNDQMETLKAQLGQRGLNLEMFCSFTGKSEEQLREDARPEAEQNLRVHAAVERIVELEQIKVSEQEIADALNDICVQNQMTMEQLQEVYDEAFATAVIRSLQMRKAMALVRSEAIIMEIE